MGSVFKRIGLAVAFSPRVEALLAEAVRLKKMWGSELTLIHIGDRNETDDRKMQDLIARVNLRPQDISVCWETGKPAKTILKVCDREKIDLLIAGALKKEKTIQNYLGTIARKILHKANCSVLMLINPSLEPNGFSNIVVNADEDSPHCREALQLACRIGLAEKSNWLHVVRELRLMSLLTATEQYSETEYEKKKHGLVQSEIDEMQQTLNQIPHAGLKVNIKLVSGKSGFELSQFAQRKKANLLIVGAPARKLSFIDRLFPHDLEYIFADLPCNLLVVKPVKN